jgi:hypothetical protein
MQRRADRHLDGLEIELVRFPSGGEDNPEQLVYLTGDFLLDRFDGFFSWADGGISSTGRSWQICSLTSNNCSPSSRKRWHSATSRCALARLAGEDKVSVTVLPCTLRVRR